MNRSQARYLTAAERTLVDRTVPRRLTGLDEDELVALHDRVRRAASKYRTLHRRQAASKVRQERSRGKARGSNEGTAVKAEIFEEALSRVSAALARAARSSAKQLKAERLAAARGEKRPAKAAASRGTATAKRGSPAKPRARGRGAAASTRTPASAKRRASTKATGARRQARRDAR